MVETDTSRCIFLSSWGLSHERFPKKRHTQIVLWICFNLLFASVEQHNKRKRKWKTLLQCNKKMDTHSHKHKQYYRVCRYSYVAGFNRRSSSRLIVIGLLLFNVSGILTKNETTSERRRASLNIHHHSKFVHLFSLRFNRRIIKPCRFAFTYASNCWLAVAMRPRERF